MYCCKRLKTSIFIVFSLFISSALAQNNNSNDINADPLENFNRHAYHLNDAIDRILIKPLATIYNALLPKQLNKGICNMFSNVSDIPSVPNDILQGNLPQALRDLLRIGVNTTIGLGGFFDVATYFGLQRNPEDLGLTFARWGYEDSTYFVIPFFGPSTIRDAVGLPINYEYFTIYPYIHNVVLRNTLWSTSLVVWRADALKYEKVLQELSLDPYVFQRNAYMQHRRFLINRNKGVKSEDSFVPQYNARQ